MVERILKAIYQIRADGVRYNRMCFMNQVGLGHLLNLPQIVNPFSCS